MSQVKFSVKILAGTPKHFTQHVQVEKIGQDLKMSCDSGDRECVHLIEASNIPEFCQELGAPEVDPMLAVILRAEAGRGQEVIQAGHKHGRTLFVWP